MEIYFNTGKDGYDMLQGCPVLVDVDNAPILPTVVKEYFQMMEVLNGKNDLSTPAIQKLVTRW